MDRFPAFMRTAVRLLFTGFSRLPHSLCLIVFHLTIANFVEYGVPLPNLYNYLHSVPANLSYGSVCRSVPEFFRQFFGDSFFLRVLTQLFLRVDSKTEISAFDAESCVRLIGAVTRTA